MEVVAVEFISQNVVAVSALHVALVLSGFLKILKGFISENVHAKNFASIYFLFERPISVVIVKSLEIVVEVLIYVEYTNTHEFKPFEELVDLSTKDGSEEDYPEGYEKRQGWFGEVISAWAESRGPDVL